jgi:hypothetical protein
MNLSPTDYQLIVETLKRASTDAYKGFASAAIESQNAKKAGRSGSAEKHEARGYLAQVCQLTRLVSRIEGSKSFKRASGRRKPRGRPAQESIR